MLRILQRRRLGFCTKPPSCNSFSSVNNSHTHKHSNVNSSGNVKNIYRSHSSHSHSHYHSNCNKNNNTSSHGHSHGASLESNLSEHHVRQCRLATIAGGCTNVFFSATKIWLGSAGGSVALVADGFHAFTDIMADIVSYVCITFARKSFPRCRFPFGIGRMETTGAVIVAAILLFGGIALLLQSSQLCYKDAQKLLWQHENNNNNNNNNVNNHYHHKGNEPIEPTHTSPSTMKEYNNKHEHNVEVQEQQQLEQKTQHFREDSFHEQHEQSSEELSSKAEKQNMEHSHHEHEHDHEHEHGHSHFTLVRVDVESGKEMILWSMVLLAGSSVICKELLFQWTRRVGVAAGSRVVVANAYHHRADAWSGGVALLGVAAQCAGIPAVDGLAGLVVSLSIVKIGYSLLKDSIMEFFDYQGQEVAEVRTLLQRLYYPLPPRIYGSTSQTNTLCNNEEEYNASKYALNSNVASITPTQMYNMQQESFINKSNSLLQHNNNNSNNNTNDDNTSTGDDVNKMKMKDVNNETSTLSRSLNNAKPIRFINAFLTRHGHAYCLLVTLLVPSNTLASEIQRAINELTALARQKVEVHETFIKVLVCSETEVTSRTAYLATIEQHVNETINNDNNNNDNNNNQNNSSDNDENNDTSKNNSLTQTEEHNSATNKNDIVNLLKKTEAISVSTQEHAHPHEPIAATGECVNPSLEQCICTLHLTHHFVEPIRYSWEERVIYVHDPVSMDCYADVLSVAQQYSCTVHTEGKLPNDSNLNNNNSCNFCIDDAKQQ